MIFVIKDGLFQFQHHSLIVTSTVLRLIKTVVANGIAINHRFAWK